MKLSHSLPWLVPGHRVSLHSSWKMLEQESSVKVVLIQVQGPDTPVRGLQAGGQGSRVRTFLLMKALVVVVDLGTQVRTPTHTISL